jgi:anti-sigma-K factor RskA
MTDHTENSRLDEDLALAGELALRVLSPEDEAAARARASAEPAFATHVEAWNERLGRLADGIAPVEPSAQVWPRVEAGLTVPVAANDNRVVFWRRWAIGSTGLLAASLAAVVMLAAQPVPAPEVATAPPPACGRALPWRRRRPWPRRPGRTGPDRGCGAKWSNHRWPRPAAHRPRA